MKRDLFSPPVSDSIESLRDQRSLLSSERFRELAELKALKATARRTKSAADEKAVDKCTARVDRLNAELCNVRQKLYRLTRTATP